MGKWFKFRVLSLLLLVAAISIALAIYLAIYQPGNISIRTASGELLIDHSDIEFVDWEKQRYRLRPGLKKELSERFHAEGGLIGGVPFQFCIDEDTIFMGRLTSSLSSFGFTDIAIDLMPVSEKDATIVLEWGYPQGPSPKRSEDPRYRHRIFMSLWLDGKLSPTNGG